MFCYMLTFNPLFEDTEVKFCTYLRILYEQFIIQNIAEIIKTDKGFSAFIFTFKDNLPEIISSNHIKEKLGIDYEQDFSLEYLGVHMDDVDLCQCKQSPFYILHSNIGYDGPLICGKCQKNIDVSKFKDAIHIDLLNWKEAFGHMYNFWLCSIDDETSFYERNDINSKLTEYGLEICRKFRSMYGLSVYYTLDKDISEDLCPKCKEKLHGLKKNQQPYTHICKKCGLIFIEQDYKEGCDGNANNSNRVKK